jgi:hypothetical protein
MRLFFEEGGIVMWPTAAFGLVLIATSILGLRGQDRLRRPLVFGLLTLTSGALGTVMGLINTMRWVMKAPATEQLVGGATGIAESLNNLVLAFLLVLLALLVSAIGVLRRPEPVSAR